MAMPHVYFGWYVVGGAFCLAMFGWGLGFYGVAVYIAELRETHGWSAALLGSFVTAYYLFGALLLGLYDSAVSRFGARLVTLAGIGAMTVSVLTVAEVRTPGQFLAACLVMAVGWATMSLTAVTAMVSPWFQQRRGLALSLALNGASCGGIILAPTLIWLTELWGLQAALRACTAVMLAMLVPITLGLFRRPATRRGAHRDGRAAPPDRAPPGTAHPVAGRRRLLASVRFWMVALPFALGLLAQVGFLTHQVVSLTPYLGAAGAATALAATTAAAVVGRVLLGLVVDRSDPRVATAGCLVVQAVALLIMAIRPEPGFLYPGCVLFGLSVGNLITLPALVAERAFPPGDYLKAVGLIAAVSQVFYAFGPALLGVIAELTHGYTLAWAACVVLELLAALMLLVYPRSA